MKLVVLVALVSSSGCYMHAVRDGRTTRREEIEVIEGRPGPSEMTLTVSPGEVMVTLASRQVCLRQRFVVTETTTDKHAEVVEVEGGDSGEGDGADRSIGLYNSALMYVFAAPVAIVLIAASAVVTGIEVAVARPHTSRERAL